MLGAARLRLNLLLGCKANTLKVKSSPASVCSKSVIETPLFVSVDCCRWRGVVLICSDAPPIRRCACWLGICWLGDCWLGVYCLGARWLLEGLAVRQSLILSFLALVSLAQ